MKNPRITGTGTRAVNFVIDTFFVFILAFIAFKVYKWYVLYYRIPYYNFGWFFAASVFVYYTFFEGIFARTPGKWFTQSKVVGHNGFRPSFFKIVIRSFVRLTMIDMFFLPFLNRTLHDHLSKTDVADA